MLKALLDGFGGAGGVVWPLFGILAPTLGLSIGSTAACLLGGACGLGFLVLCSSLAYASYSQQQQEQQKIQEKLQQYRQTFSLVFNQLNNENLIENHSTLKCYSHCKNSDEALNKFLHEQRQKEKLVPLFKLILAGIVGFCTGFGTVAGGTAGICGVFVGIGLIAGFAALPPLGMFALATASLLGIYMAQLQIKSVKKHALLQFECKSIKNLINSINIQPGVNGLIPTTQRQKKVKTVKLSRSQSCNNVSELSSIHSPLFWQPSAPVKNTTITNDDSVDNSKRIAYSRA